MIPLDKFFSEKREIEIYTVGHSNWDFKVFVNPLFIHQIDLVVDVRSVPYSHNKEFSRNNLVANLKKVNIDYLYLGDSLGGRPKDADCYKNGKIPEKRSDFLKYVDFTKVESKKWYLKGIEMLVQKAKETKTAIMCSEANPFQCHREKLIAQTLLKRGIKVFHLNRDGTTIESELIQKDDPKKDQKTLETYLQ